MDFSFSDICLCELCNCKKGLLQKENFELKNELILLQNKYKLLEKKYNRYNECLSLRCFCEICPGTKCESCNNDDTLVCEFCGNNYCDEECNEHICKVKLLEKVSTKENKLLEKVSTKENKLLEKVSTNKIEDYLPSEDIYFGCSYKYCENDHSKDTYYISNVNENFSEIQNELLDKFDWDFCKICDVFYLIE